jgi:hypothetical protein
VVSPVYCTGSICERIVDDVRVFKVGAMLCLGCVDTDWMRVRRTPQVDQRTNSRGLQTSLYLTYTTFLECLNCSPKLKDYLNKLVERLRRADEGVAVANFSASRHA